MPSLAITGTIGSGKSRTLQLLGTLLRVEEQEIFSADKENGLLLDADPEVRALIISRLGNCCYRDDGKADRKRIFEIIRDDATALSTIEGILHPRLEALWKPKSAYYRKSRNSFFIAEIPLLYEKHLEGFFDKSVVVGCSGSIRTERLQRSRSLTAAEAAAWTNLQASQQAKIAEADHLLWNDGSQALLEQQIHLLASHLLSS
jgi:dephospho-CoA kinase